MRRRGTGESSPTRRERTRHEKTTRNGVGLRIWLRTEKPNPKPKGEKKKKKKKRAKRVWALGLVKDWPKWPGNEFLLR